MENTLSPLMTALELLNQSQLKLVDTTSAQLTVVDMFERGLISFDILAEEMADYAEAQVINETSVQLCLEAVNAASRDLVAKNKVVQ